MTTQNEHTTQNSNQAQHSANAVEHEKYRYLRNVTYSRHGLAIEGKAPTLTVHDDDSGYDIVFVSLGSPNMEAKAKHTLAVLNSYDANQRTIAELLEALEATEDLLSRFVSQYVNPEDNPTVSKARAAIAKARGASQ